MNIQETQLKIKIFSQMLLRHLPLKLVRLDEPQTSPQSIFHFAPTSRSWPYSSIAKLAHSSTASSADVWLAHYSLEIWLAEGHLRRALPPGRASALQVLAERCVAHPRALVTDRPITGVVVCVRAASKWRVGGGDDVPSRGNFASLSGGAGSTEVGVSSDSPPPAPRRTDASD